MRGLLADAEGSESVEALPRNMDDAFCFAFIRHPLDRLCSAHRMFRSYPVQSAGDQRLREALSLADVLNIVEDATIAVSKIGYRENLKLHALPMTDPRYALERADFVGRFEHFHRDYQVVADRLGLVAKAVPHFRFRPHAIDIPIGAELRARIDDVYRADFERFYPD